jgi:hypothetical protein
MTYDDRLARAEAELRDAEAEVAMHAKAEPLPAGYTPDDLGLPAAHARMVAAQSELDRLRRGQGGG